MVAVVDVIEVRGRGGKRGGEGEEGGRGGTRGGGRGGKRDQEGEEGGRGGEDVLAVEVVWRRGRRRGRLRGRRIGRLPVLRSERRTKGIDRILIPCVRQRIYLSAYLSIYISIYMFFALAVPEVSVSTTLDRDILCRVPVSCCLSQAFQVLFVSFVFIDAVYLLSTFECSMRILYHST